MPSVDFTLTIPSELTPVVTTCLCAAGGYAEVSEANAKAAVIDWIIRTVQNVQAAQAASKTPPLPPPITGLA